MYCVLLLFFLSVGALTQAEHRRSDDTNRIDMLETLVQQQASTIQTLTARLDAQDNKLQEQTSTINSLQSHQRSLITSVAKQEQLVAFYADLMNRHPSGSYNLTKGEPLKFSKVYENLGHAFNSNTGIFTTPYSGLYMFNFHFTGKGNNTNFAIKKGFSTAAVAYVNSGSTYESDSCTTFIQLSPGEQVTVQYIQGDPTIARGVNIGISFSGVLIHAI